MELDLEISSSKSCHQKEKDILEFVIDETLIKVGSEYIWLWVAIELERENSRTIHI